MVTIAAESPGADGAPPLRDVQAEPAGGTVVVCPARGGVYDGVGDYTDHLAAHLAMSDSVCRVTTGRHGDTSEPPARGTNHLTFIELDAGGWRALWRRRHEPQLHYASTVLLQYVPQLYLHDRTLPWLVWWLGYMRFVRGAVVVLTAHEFSVPMRASLRRLLARVTFDAAASLLGLLAHRVVTTCELTQRNFGRLLFWRRRRISVIPAGSNVPRDPAAVNGRRDDRVVTIFGQPAAMDPAAIRAVGRWAAERGDGVRVRWVGRSRDEILAFLRACDLSPDVIEVHGGVEPARLSRMLATSAVALAPLCDGVSLRRTTIMAALEHGAPLVGTVGPCTDRVFLNSDAVRLAADTAGLLRALEQLLADSGERAALGRRGRDLFISRFSWDRIAATYRALVADATGRPHSA
jgi:glycosyltransferase involved in cell wall biosynthesis